MAIDPRLGYDPGQNSGAPQTREQWIADVTTSMVLEFANAIGGATSGAMSADLFARAGLVFPDVQYMGTSNPNNPNGRGNTNNAIPPSVYNAMAAMAEYLAGNPSEAAAAGFGASPTVSGGPVLSPTDQQNAFNATQNAAQNATSLAMNTANNATSVATSAADNATSRANNADSNTTNRAIAALQEGGATARAAADIASRMSIAQLQETGSMSRAQLQATVDRESIAAQTATSNLDRTSRETISANSLKEQGREFDISTVEDRKNFNATMVFNLFDRGIALAKAPVDWLGYQYYMANLGIPMTYVNATSMATQLGAVPPSGPSSMGPVVGGPAALDGDGALAAQVGVQPALVPVSQAVQAHPGSAQTPGMEQFTATNMLATWVQQAGGAQQLDAMVAQERATMLPQVVGDNPVIQQAVQQAQQHAPVPLDAAQQQMPPIPHIPGMPWSGAPGANGTVYTGGTDPNGNATGQPISDTGVSSAGQPWSGAMPWQQTGLPAGMAPATTPGQQIGYGNDQQLHQVQPVPAVAVPTAAPAIPGASAASIMPPVPGAAPQSITTGGNTGTDRGVFTGAAQTTPAAGATSAFGAPMTGTGTTNPQGDQMLQALSDSLGIPIDQLRQIVPTNLLAGGYSLDTIKNSPVIQALQNPNGPGMGFYRTAPVDGSKFGNIQAFGVPLGIRGGQDVNAQTFLQAPQATQDMMQGAITATGQSWPDVQAQMFRSSPLTNYTPGAFGKRRFAA